MRNEWNDVCRSWEEWLRNLGFFGVVVLVRVGGYLFSLCKVFRVHGRKVFYRRVVSVF